jgi:hypothetical protein
MDWAALVFRYGNVGGLPAPILQEIKLRLHLLAPTDTVTVDGNLGHGTWCVYRKVGDKVLEVRGYYQGIVYPITTVPAASKRREEAEENE